MRTTLSIDDDVLSAARHLAERDNKTLGEVLSGLARKGLAGRSGRVTRAERNGIPLLPAHGGAKAVTLELVNRLRDEES